MKKKWVSFLILGGSLVLTAVLFKITPSELAPLDDRSLLRYSVTGSEGATYEYMTRYMDKVASIGLPIQYPKKNVNLENCFTRRRRWRFG